MTATRWFPPSAATGTETVQLVCLPHAGAAASAYLEWTPLRDKGIEVVPVQLAGRGARFPEPASSSATEIVGQLADPLLDRVDRPFALFGHSMGALLAYELAHALADRGRPPAHLFVSGYVPPHLPPHSGDLVVHALPDDELVEHVTSLAGTDAEVLGHPELLAVLLPVLRADFAVCETYRPVERPPLRVPVTALGGVDDPDLGEGVLEGWAVVTEAAFTAKSFPGGHFYLQERVRDVLDVIARTLTGPAAETGPR